jgi:hypothetical protein
MSVKESAVGHGLQLKIEIKLKRNHPTTITGILTHRTFDMKTLLTIVFIIFLPIASIAQEEPIEASIDIKVESHSRYQHINLAAMHPALAKGVKNTKLTSATLGFPITHYVQSETLKFFMPSETELSGDYLHEFETIRIVTDENGQTNGKVVKEGGACEGLHPMLFEGETLDDLLFRIYILLLVKSYMGSGDLPCGLHPGNEIAVMGDFSLDMDPYLVLTRDNTVKIQLPKDTGSVDSVSIREYDKRSGRDKLSENIVDSFSVDLKSGYMVMKPELKKRLLNMLSPIIFYIETGTAEEYLSNYDSNDDSVPGRNPCVMMQLLIGTCNFKGRLTDRQGKTPDYKPDDSVRLNMRCETGNINKILGINSSFADPRTQMYITQYTMPNADWTFDFKNVPNNIGCSFDAEDANGIRYTVDERSLVYECDEPVKEVVWGTDEDDVITITWTDVVKEINGGGGNDIITTGFYDDNLFGGEGDDILNGSNGSNNLSGGKGNDTLNGGRDDDNYFFNLGDGHDTIYDTGGANDTLIFGARITRNDLSARIIDGDFVIGLKEPGKSFSKYFDKVIIKSVLNESNQIEHIRFSDGTVLDLVGIASLQGTNEADNISWFPAGLDIDADAGDDIVTCSDFADTIAGGKGDDILYGKWGSDTYKYNLGDGLDIIYESGGENDIILYGDSIAFKYLVARIDGSDLIIAIIENGKSFDKLTDSITIKNYTGITAYKIETLKFSDGTQYKLGDVLNELLFRYFWID